MEFAAYSGVRTHMHKFVKTSESAHIHVAMKNGCDDGHGGWFDDRVHLWVIQYHKVRKKFPQTYVKAFSNKFVSTAERAQDREERWLRSRNTC
jgi:hypothetical protein